jgi:hypothetical protein
LADRGDRLVREHDQVEVVDRDRRVGQSRADGGRVAGVRVDHDHLDRRPEHLAAGAQPGLDRGAGPAVDLPQQRLVAGNVDESGLPWVRALPPDPAVVLVPVVRLSTIRMDLVTGVIAYALLSYSVTSNMLTPLLPSLEHTYGVGPVAGLWISLVALLTGAALVPSLCRIGDTMDAKKGMAMLALGCLMVGGVISALSTTIPVLLVGRGLQGVALLVFPMAAGIVNDEFPVC